MVDTLDRLSAKGGEKFVPLPLVFDLDHQHAPYSVPHMEIYFPLQGHTYYGDLLPLARTFSYSVE